MYLMSPLFCEKGGDTIQGRTLYKGGHYLRKYGTYADIEFGLIFYNFSRISFLNFLNTCCHFGFFTFEQLLIIVNSVQILKDKKLIKSGFFL